MYLLNFPVHVTLRAKYLSCPNTHLRFHDSFHFDIIISVVSTLQVVSWLKTLIVIWFAIDILKQSTHVHVHWCTCTHMHSHTHTLPQGSYVDVYTKCIIYFSFFLQVASWMLSRRKIQILTRTTPHTNLTGIIKWHLGCRYLYELLFVLFKDVFYLCRDAGHTDVS